jgi:pimeloyl-ACP methyl ester carboxylesterase
VSRLQLMSLVLSLCLVGIATYVLAARSGAFSTSANEIERRQARDASRFVDIDGVKLHFLDEGGGDTIVLLHGSYLDLVVWDEWADTLSASMRVLRLDRPPFGISGLDPSGAYSYERETELLGRFLDEVGAQQFVLVGASSAGTVAARYAAMHPERISRLVLINFPLSRGDIRPRWSYRSVRWLRDTVLMHHQPSFITRRYIVENSVTALPRPSDLVQRLTDQANREGVLGAQRALEQGAGAYSAAARLADMQNLQAPTLLIWGGQNPLLTVESGRSAFEAVGAEDKSMLIIDNASHMIPIDSSWEVLQAVQAFMAAPITSCAARSPDCSAASIPTS